MIEKPARLRVVLAIAAGLLAEILTIITVGIVFLGYRVVARPQSQQAVQDFMTRAGTILGPLLGVVFTFIMAYLVARRARTRSMAHGLLVAVGAVALHILGSIAAPGGYRLIHLFADLFKLAAGAAAALIAERQHPAGELPNG